MLHRRTQRSRVPFLLVALCAMQSPCSAQRAGDSKTLNAALFAAIRHNDLVAVKRLLHRGTSPNAREDRLTKPSLDTHDPGGRPELGDTPLMAAAEGGSIALMWLIISAGADVNGNGEAGFTPLITATQRGNLQVVSLLLAHGARPDQRNDYGDTALLFAANDGNKVIMRALLRHGASVDGGTGRTPLMIAAESGSKEAGASASRAHWLTWGTLLAEPYPRAESSIGGSRSATRTAASGRASEEAIYSGERVTRAA